MPRRPPFASSDARTPFDFPDDEFLDDEPPLPTSTTRTLKRPGTNRLGADEFGNGDTAASGTRPSGSLRRRLTGDDRPAGNDAPGRNAGSASGRASGAALATKSGTRSLFDPPPPARSSRAKIASPPPARGMARRVMWREVTGVCCIALGLVLLINTSRGETDSLITNVRWVLRGIFGVGVLVVPVAMVLWGALLIAGRERTKLRAFERGVAAAFCVGLAWIHLGVARSEEFAGSAVLANGGVLGASLAWGLRTLVGDIGAHITLGAVTLVCLLLWTELSLGALGGRVARTSKQLWGHVVAHHHVLRSAPPATPESKADSGSNGRAAEPESDFFVASTPQIMARNARAAAPPRSASAHHVTLPPVPDAEELLDEEFPAELPHASLRSADAAGKAGDTPRVEISYGLPPVSILETSGDEVLTPAELLEAQAQASAGDAAPDEKLKIPDRPCRTFGTSVMPPYFDETLRALDAPIPADVSGVEDDIAEGVAAVQDTLAAFKVDARVTDVKRGPVITRYEVQPAPGVRVAAIANLDRDLARSLSAIAVRIEAPVPGKNVVGIEVPNKRVHLVRLRDVLELPEFLAAPSKLSFVLGRDIAGQPKWADLTKMPHLLIAGATNSGKSVCLNSIIASILCRATPEEVKFSLIDPKRVELTLFRDIKHLYHPVVVEPKDAVRALRGAIAEMDRRYRRFAERGVRNIASYNSKLEPDEQPLPYLVIVIDELADLMMTAAAEFEKLICRLAQLARATGIHLIVATQRPSVNVITGVIKANIPARIAFAVASQVDSRTILDSVGAERLIGSGDMLFDANNGGKALRIQGAYLSEEEVNRVVTSVKASYAGDPHPLDYGMDLALVEDDEAMGGGSSDEPIEKRDELYGEIKSFVVRHQEMSASMIQRKFEIGYPRAGRIVDQLERDGVLGPADGPKPRKVLGAGS